MYDSVYIYAYSALSSPSLAEEVVQEVFRIACAKPNAVMGSDNPNGWVMNTAKNVIFNMRRTYSRMATLVVRTLHEEGEVVDPSKCDDYTTAEYSDLLAPAEFELIKRMALDKCSPGEMALELGISVEACKKRVLRARKRLQKILNSIDVTCP